MLSNFDELDESKNNKTENTSFFTDKTNDVEDNYISKNTTKYIQQGHRNNLMTFTKFILDDEDFDY